MWIFDGEGRKEHGREADAVYKSGIIDIIDRLIGV